MLKNCLKFLIFLLSLNLQIFPQIKPSRTPILTNGIENALERPLTLCRKIELSDQEIKAYIASDNKELFVPSTDGKIKSLNPLSGTVNWETDLGGEIISPPYLFGDFFVVVSKSFHKNEIQNEDSVESVLIRNIDKKSGIVKWHTILKFKVKGLILYQFGDVLVIANNFGDFYLLDKADGKMITKKAFQKAFSTAPFFENERIFFATIDKEIIEISAKTFEVIRIIKVSEIPFMLFAYGENIVWSNKSGKIICLRMGTQENIRMGTGKYKQKWVLQSGGKTFSIMPFRKSLLITSLDNYIYSVADKNGNIIWKQRLSGRPSFEPLLVENYLVMTIVGDPTALLIEAQSGKIINKINTGAENFFVSNPKIVSSLLLLLTNKGLFFYALETNCNQT